MSGDSPIIWTRRLKIIEPRDPVFFRPAMAGYWKLEAHKPDGRTRVVADWFPNLITDGGLELPGSTNGWVRKCVVGTGNATPSTSDTTLQTQIAVTSSNISISSGNNQGEDRYAYARKTFRFSAGAAAGNISEIGILGGNDDTLFSRALIVDGEGSPTIVTVLSDEVLDATYELRLYPPLTDVETTFMVGATEHDIVVRAADVDGSWGLRNGGLAQDVGFTAGTCTRGASLFPSTSTLGSVTGIPSGTASDNSSSANSTYNLGTFVRDFSYTWNLTSGNVSGGAAAALVNCGDQTSGAGEARGACSFQISFDPVIPKTSSNNLVLNFRQAWTRRTI